MTTLPMKRGDRLPEVATQLIGADGLHVDLTGCTVTFTIRAANGRVLVNAAPATLVQANQGRVKYVWQVGDTDVVGTHDVEWIVTYPAGQQLTVPNRGYDKIEINARLT
jgi:hypothetical protein